MNKLPEALLLKFWNNVDRQGLVHPIIGTRCWVWTGCRSKKLGYGTINGWLAHRLSRTIHSGDIPDGMLVCHHCDNRICVNPDHLFIGTIADNNKDMKEKDRHARGERKKRTAKLTEKEVREIKALYERGNRGLTGTVNTYVLAEMYGLNQSSISRIIHGKRWAHVTT